MGPWPLDFILLRAPYAIADEWQIPVGSGELIHAGAPAPAAPGAD